MLFIMKRAQDGEEVDVIKFWNEVHLLEKKLSWINFDNDDIYKNMRGVHLLEGT